MQQGDISEVAEPYMKDDKASIVVISSLKGIGCARVFIPGSRGNIDVHFNPNHTP